VKAREVRTDYVKERMIADAADNEPTFDSAAALLPPSRDYAMVGNRGAHTKFSVSQDGRVKCANYSIYTPMEQADQANGTERPLSLFDPRMHVAFWPETNFSDYKSAVIGRFSRAVSVGAWDQKAKRGFVLTAAPNTQRGFDTGEETSKGNRGYDHAELLLRLEDVKGEVYTPPQYIAVLSCTNSTDWHDESHGWVGQSWYVTCPRDTATLRNLTEPAEFYAHLLAHTLGWEHFHLRGSGAEAAQDVASKGLGGAGGTPLRVWLEDGQGDAAANFSSEGTRLVDMSRAVITSSMSLWVGEGGLRPNYGDGTNYWSVGQKDRGSLPLESYAMDRRYIRV